MRKELYAKLTKEQKEKVRANDLKWKREHPLTPEQKSLKSIKDRAYYLLNADRLKEYAKKYSPAWAKANPERWHLIQKRHRLKLREQTLDAYGGKCACCGLTERGFLSIDHIDNDGTAHRRREHLSGAGYHIYNWLKQHQYPVGFQVLCYNCNLARQFLGQCPHQSNPSSFNR